MIARYRIRIGALALGMSVALAYGAGAPVADLAERAQWAELRAALDTPADVNAAQADGTTALMWAAYHEEAEIAAALLAAGADPGATNRFGVSALSQAALVGDADTLRELLTAGADANTAMPEGDTALMLAARSGSLESVELLLDHGAIVDARDEWHGESALMWAAGENHPDIVRVLAAHGAEIDAASTAFDWDYVKQVGVSSQLPRGGLTALAHAARDNAYDAAAVLLELGADPSFVDPQGISILRIAITNNNLDLAKLLIENGADVNDGALVEAVKLRTMPWVRAAKHRVDATTDLELIELLIAQGADVHLVPETGMVKQNWTDGEHPNEPPLYLAAMQGDRELMSLLADAGATPEQSVGSKGASVLMAALDFTPHTPAGGVPKYRSAEDAIEAAELALELGADVNAVNEDQMTALHFAAEKGYDERVQFLIDNGARLDLKDRSNRLPIDAANGVPAIPKKGTPPPPGQGPEIHDSTVSLLREAMNAAGVEETPYSAPPPDTEDEQTDGEDS